MFPLLAVIVGLAIDELPKANVGLEAVVKAGEARKDDIPGVIGADSGLKKLGMVEGLEAPTSLSKDCVFCLSSAGLVVAVPDVDGPSAVAPNTKNPGEEDFGALKENDWAGGFSVDEGGIDQENPGEEGAEAVVVGGTVVP